MRAWWQIAVVTLALSLCGAVRAQPELRTRAKAHYRAGTTFFEAADFDKAIDEFRAGYELLPLPEFLFNLGQAYRLKKDASNAIGYYKKYLATKPGGDDSAEAREHLAELTPSAPSTNELANPPPHTSGSLPALSLTAEQSIQNRTTTALGAQTPPPPPRRPLYKRWWLWAVAGTVAAAVTAVAIGVAESQSKEPLLQVHYP